MFFSKQDKNQQDEYVNLLKLMGSLSNLFSEATEPYLHYRVAEKVFCKAFAADDLSRDDVALDAKKMNLGIGLKTFVEKNNKTNQKVAEFNRLSGNFKDLSNDDLVRKVAKYRNDRIDFTEKAHNINNSIYHCVVRGENAFSIFEEPMHRVDIENISEVTKKKNTIYFNDGINDYTFSLSKNTLLKRFSISSTEMKFNVSIIEDPIDALRNLYIDSNVAFRRTEKFVYLPLYGRNKTVFEKSGLNQWNAGGRDRNPNEVYIPIPADIHKKFPGFFPERDVMFNLQFPDGEKVEASVCQDGGKALMTKKNKKLGKLILRDGLKLEEGELVTYEKLTLLGCDSVRIEKLEEDLFKIDFAKVGSYEVFKSSWK